MARLQEASATQTTLREIRMETRTLLDDATERGRRDSSCEEETTFMQEIASDSDGGNMTQKNGAIARQLPQKISMIHGIGLITGVIIGSGIFFTPNEILDNAGSTGLSLLIWIAAGIISIGGALCYCELGVSIPEAGGEYIYLYRAYGPLPAFLLIWSTALVTQPASEAIMSLAFARYLVQPFYSENCEPSVMIVKPVAVATVLLLGIVNAVSVKAAVYTQNILLLAKVFALIAIVLMGVYWSIHNGIKSLSSGFQGSTSSPSDIGLAFYNALWAYEGWNNLNYAAEEVKNPHKNIPRAIVIGLLLSIVCYLAVNVAYFAVLDKSEFTEAVAIYVGKKVIGKTGLVLIPLFVAMSCFGSANGSLFTSSRVLFAAARQGQLPSTLALVHKGFATPLPAVIMQVFLCMLLVSIGTLESLLEAYSFMAWIIYAFSFLSVYVIRYKEPTLYRPFQVWLWLPGVMIVVSLFLIVIPLLKQPLHFLVILMFVPGTMVFYYIIKDHAKCSRLKQWNDSLRDVVIHLCNVHETAAT